MYVVSVDSIDQASFPKSNEVLQTITHNLTHRNVIITLSHTDYRKMLGGTEKVIRAEKALFGKMDISYLHIFPAFIPFIPLDDNPMFGVSIDGNFIGFHTLSDLGLVLKLLAENGTIQPVACHLHHLKGISLTMVDHLIRIVNPPKIRFFIHDYFAICPQFNLLRDGGVFCGAPPLESETCSKCSWGRARHFHVTSFKNFFINHAIEFIAPSQVAADIWDASQLYQNTTVRIVPHFQTSEIQPAPAQAVRNTPRIRIAYLGYQADIKGWQTWSRIVQTVNPEQYEFYHIGSAENQLPGVLHFPVPLEQGEENPVVDQLKQLDIDIALLWSVWPETYSFTLFESLAGRCFIITNPSSGNIASVVRDRSAGAVFGSETELVDFLYNASRVREIVTEYRTICPFIELSWNAYIPEETARSQKDSVHQQYPQRLIQSSSPYDILFSLETELHLGKLVSDLGIHVTGQASQIRQMQEQIALLEKDLHNLHAERESSIIWRFTTLFHSFFVDRGLPPGTERRRMYDRSLIFCRRILLKEDKEKYGNN